MQQVGEGTLFFYSYTIFIKNNVTLSYIKIVLVAFTAY